MLSSRISAVMACIVVLLPVATLADPPTAVPGVISKIVERFEADSAGVTATRESIVYDQRAPGKNEHDEQELTVLQQDRRVIGSRLHRIVKDGHVDSPNELAQAQADADKRYTSTSPLRTRFAMPYYPESAAEYSYGTAKPCASCGAGMQTIDFSSSASDDRHIRGSMTFDGATFRPLKLEFTPNVLPKFATSAKLTYTFGPHDEGGWGIVRIEEHYTGRMLLISGSADNTTTMVRVKRFATVDAARKAIEAGTI